ncbi:hypothetical protein NM688_g1120 [Phlebia brevispora]|uniref:Uncharacterized protein n=1 Tax=Phlebia brevispora TaxID=194682 RepID=A0ACC1TC29_9APHY|nr:hypothetical protein NM688_g1120 [Phlebia brevispora]
MSCGHIFLIFSAFLSVGRTLANHPSQYRRHEIYSRSDTPAFYVDAYHPTPLHETYGLGIDHPLSKRTGATLADSAVAFLRSKTGIDVNVTHVHASYEGSHSDYAYVTQYHEGVPIANAVANVAFNKAGQVIALGSSFVQTTNAASTVPSVTIAEAITTAESMLDGTYDEAHLPAPTLSFLARPDGSLALAHTFYVRNATALTWYEAFVDAHTGELLSVNNFVAEAVYRALPITEQVLTQGFEDIVDPQDPIASPIGWHNDGRSTYNTTVGNNGMSFKTIQANTTVESGPNLTFIFPQNPALDPTVQTNLDAARVNGFYIVNVVHDYSYRYGFTETAFNFQWDNFGLGGSGNDRVEVIVQYQGLNNALFTTLPDGINGFMYLFLWDYTNPERDGTLENDIIVHENTHGITNRMTGGGTATCLQTLEAGGLGEGWSDMMAEWTEQTSAVITDYVIGPYVTNSTAGIRTYPYSTNATINPLKYSSVATLNEVHKIGEVWANMLHNVYAALVGAHGFSQEAFTNPSGSEGNIVFLHLFIDALPIQPCNPTFVAARNAWIQADVTRYDGANKCILWDAFASRGLGLNAANYTDDFTVPTGC